MNPNNVATVLEELRATTRQLQPDANANHLDLDRMEKAVADREHSVARLRELTLRHPDAFTPQDVVELQRILAEGKRASENLMDLSRQGWTTASQLHKKELVLKTFLRYGTGPPA